MSELREVAVGVVVTLLVLMVLIAANANLLLDGDFPKRFTVRQLLIGATALAVLLGMCVAFSPR